jgi:hypothetical protein
VRLAFAGGFCGPALVACAAVGGTAHVGQEETGPVAVRRQKVGFDANMGQQAEVESGRLKGLWQLSELTPSAKYVIRGTMMKSKLTESPIAAVLVIAVLAAGTLLVAGYAEKPNADTQVVTDAKCAACPLQKSEPCCKADERCCEKGLSCASLCEKDTCEGTTSGCPMEKAAGASCPVLDCGGQAKTACGTGGCSLSK